MNKPKSQKQHLNKPKYSLLPLQALQPVIQALEYGADKYGPNDWKISDIGWDKRLDATLRHLTQAQDNPRSVDTESGVSHLAHAITNLLFQLHWLDKVPVETHGP